MGNRGLAKEVKADLSRTHFTLGNHKFDWQTDAMRTQVSAIASSVLATFFSINIISAGCVQYSVSIYYYLHLACRHSSPDCIAGSESIFPPTPYMMSHFQHVVPPLNVALKSPTSLTSIVTETLWSSFRRNDTPFEKKSASHKTYACILPSTARALSNALSSVQLEVGIQGDTVAPIDSTG